MRMSARMTVGFTLPYWLADCSRTNERFRLFAADPESAGIPSLYIRTPATAMCPSRS